MTEKYWEVPHNQLALQIEKLSKIYNDKINNIALDDISLNVPVGSIFGLLGPNGVGKSTIFNLITGLLKPDFGSIIIGKENVVNYAIAERANKFKISFVPQYGGYFHDLTLLENLNAIAEIQINHEKDRLNKIEILISKFEFETILNIKAIVPLLVAVGKSSALE